MKELRCLAFSEEEVTRAVIELMNKLRRSLPRGTIDKILYQEILDTVEATLIIRDDDGKEHSVKLTEQEVSASLVNYCLSRQIPLPRQSARYLRVIDGDLSLVLDQDHSLPSVSAKKPGRDVQPP